MSLPLWVEFFDDLQQVRGRSRNTVMAYRRDLELYADFVKARKDISAFFQFMKSHGLSPRSQARVVSSLRTYFKFCEGHGHKVPELQHLRPPKVKVSLPKALAVADFHRLMEGCVVEDPFKTARNQMTLMLLFGLGCRVSELVGLNLSDFHELQSWLVVLGKGNKERVIPLTEALRRELKSYLTDARPHLVQVNTNSILINDRGNRPSRVDIWRWLAAWSARSGFSETVNPHKFRHGCATALLESGADLRSIQLLLGHASLQTTQIYTSVSSRNLTETVDQHHPLSGTRPITR